MVLTRVLFVTRGWGEVDPGSANQEAALPYLAFFGFSFALEDSGWSKNYKVGVNRQILRAHFFYVFVLFERILSTFCSI